MLTLLFVCQEPKDCPQSLESARSASDHLLVGSCSEAADPLLSLGSVDAILMHQKHLQHDCDLIAKLKRFAPQTPVMLLREPTQEKQAKPPGIAATCCVDLSDEELVKSLWMFLRLILGKGILRAARTRSHR